MASTRQFSSATLLSDVVTQLRANVRPNSRVCVGLSGGRDSSVLLHLVVRAREDLAVRVGAIHVNHQISPNANSWAENCIELCAQLDVPLQIECVSVARDTGKGLEASARDARYAAFAKADADAILLGHHRDDQAETVLLQALRGTGLKGISAMPLAKPFRADKQIIRPLLDVAPQILADYAQANHLTWIHDESNDDTRYRRNYIRHDILPRLAERIPQSIESLVRLAQHAAQAQLLLDDLARIDGAIVLIGDRLNLPRLLSLPDSRAKNLLRHTFAKQSIPSPNAVQLREILSQLAARQSDNRTEISWANWQLRCYQDEIYLAPKVTAAKVNWCIEWDNKSELLLPEFCGVLLVEKTIGAGIAESRLGGKKLTVRSRIGGEKLRLSAARPRRSLKNLLQETKAPPWRREIMPLLFCDETLIWAPGIGADIAYVARENEPGLSISWHAEIN